MSETETIEQETPKENFKDPFVDSDALEECTVTVDGYKPVNLKLRPLTRQMRNECFEIAAAKFYKENEVEGFSPTTFEAEFAKRRIKWWSLPKHVSTSWGLLSPELGDAITEVIGTSQAISAVISDKMPAEVEEAKN